MNTSANMTYSGAWNDEPEFTHEIGQKALKASGYRSGDCVILTYKSDEFDILMRKHGAAPTDACMCDIGIAETFKFGIWEAGAFSTYYDCDKYINYKHDNIKIVIDIGFPSGELTRFQQFIFNMKRLIGYIFGR